MAGVSIRDLRNHGGEVIDRVQAGQRVTISCRMAELRVLPRTRPDATTLLGRWRHLPHIGPAGLRRDVDEIIDQSL